MRPARSRPHCEPVYLPATARNRLPARSRCARPTTCSRAPSRSISPRPSNPQGAVASAAYLARLVGLGAPLRLPGVRRRMLFAKSTTPDTAARHARSVRAATSPTSSCSTRCRSARTCRACASASSPATAISSRASSNCATSPRRRCRCRRRRSRSPPTATRPMSRRTAGSTSQKFDLADQIIGDRYGYRAPGRRLLPLARRVGRRAATRR